MVIDLSGQRFGNLTVVKKSGISSKRRTYWDCACDCGGHKTIRGDALRSGATTTCGCKMNYVPHNLTDLTGRRYGRLVALELDHRDNQRSAHWRCKCDCGKQTIVHMQSLKNGRTKSCGCLHDEVSAERMTRHGLCNHPIYKVHASMIQRCHNSANVQYYNYGGRGIRVCDEWRDFETFFKWAIANGYKKGLDVDRINNDGNYEPSNCHWTTRVDNSRNKRPCIHIQLRKRGKGEILSFRAMSEAAERLGINYRSLQGAVWSNRGYCGDYQIISAIRGGV